MIKKILPLIVLLLLGVSSYWVYTHPPEVKIRPAKRPTAIKVQVLALKEQPYRVRVESYGVIKPRTQNTLLPQSPGKVVFVKPNFRVGGFFEAGEELLRIDDRDYQIAVTQARAAVAQAQQAMLDQKARSEQARTDWVRLGNTGEVPDLVARKPQLEVALAQLQSAKALLQQTQINLRRTRVRAPFAGRILSKNVDVGQIVSSNSQLAVLYAVDYVEVRLPIQSRDLDFIDLPESLRYQDQAGDLPEVTFYSELVKPEVWTGKVVQTEGAIDSTTRQIYVLAQIDDPYGEVAEKKSPLKIGQYVKAKIEGRTLDNVIIVPNKAIYQGRYVYIVKDKTLQRRAITIRWQNESEAVIDQGLNSGDKLVTTTLGQVISGTPVRVVDGDVQ